jgi:serine protease inhibitor
MKDNFFKLLANSNELKKNKKILQDENPEAYNVLTNLLLTIEENFHYSEKDEYIKLAKDFLDDQITVDDFSYSFMGIYEGINQKISQMENDESSDLANFLDKTRSPGLNRLLARVYGSCDSFNLDADLTMSDEKELKNCAQSLIIQLQEK